MYQPNDPLSYQFSNAQVSPSLTEHQRRQSITGAIESQGQQTHLCHLKVKQLIDFLPILEMK